MWLANLPHNDRVDRLPTAHDRLLKIYLMRVQIPPMRLCLNQGFFFVFYKFVPFVGFNPKSPHMKAGMRTDPAKSLPMPKMDAPAAIMALSPPLLPPGIRRRSYGLQVRPNTSFSVHQFIANLGRFVNAIGMAPVSRNLNKTKLVENRRKFFWEVLKFGGSIVMKF